MIFRFKDKPEFNNENLKFGEYRLFIYKETRSEDRKLSYHIFAITNLADSTNRADLNQVFGKMCHDIIDTGKCIGDYSLPILTGMVGCYEYPPNLRSNIMDYIINDVEELRSDVRSIIGLNAIQAIATGFSLKNPSIMDLPIIILPEYLRREVEADVTTHEGHQDSNPR